MAMLTDSAEGWSQGRFCSTQDHPEPSTQGGRAKQKSRPTVAVRVPLSMELGPISAPELWRVTLRKSPAQARGQFTQFTPKLPLAIPYLVFEALLQHPKWLEGWLPLRPWCSPCLPPVLTGQLLAGCFGEGEAGEFHLHCEVTAWWGSWDVRDSDTCVVWVTASTQEPVSGAVTWPPSCPSQGLVALSHTNWEQCLSDLRSQPMGQMGHQETEAPTSSGAQLRKKKKLESLGISPVLCCWHLSSVENSGRQKKKKKDQNSLAKPVCLFTTNTFCSGLCSCFHSWKWNFFYLK